MAAIVESSSVSVQASDSTSITATEPTGTVEGDLLVAVHSADSASSSPLGLPSGWSGQSSQVSSCSARIAWIVRGASAPDLTFTANDGRQQVVVMARISGFDVVDPVTSYAFTIGSGASIPNGPAAICGDGGIIFSALGSNDFNLPTDTPVGFTIAGFAQSSAGGGACVAALTYQELATGATVDPGNWGNSNIGDNVTFGFAVNEAGDDPAPADEFFIAITGCPF